MRLLGNTQMNDTEIMEAFNGIAEKIVEAIKWNTAQQVEIVEKLDGIIVALGVLVVDDD